MARPTIKAGERSFAGQVIAWIKEQISHGGLPFGNALNDPSLYGLSTTRFPDVLLTLDEAARQPFCDWELKTPSTDPRDADLLENAVTKARVLKARYFVTWNMVSAILWTTPPRGAVTEENRLREYGPIPQVRTEDDLREGVVYHRLKEICARVLLDLGRLYEDASINLMHADTSVFVALLARTADQLYAPMLNSLNTQRANRKFDRQLDAWVKKQGVNKYDADYHKTLVRQVVYKVLSKILFYQTLRRYRLMLPPMDISGTPASQLGAKLAQFFQKARDIDYQAVFEPDITDQLKFDRESTAILSDLVQHLNQYNFDQMPLDVVGRVFEQLIPPEARHGLGQYFTREDLVDFIVAFCVRNAEDAVLDPTCGTGTFLVRAYDRLNRLASKPHHEILSQLWGVDIARFPAELATINLFRQDLADYNNFPRIVSEDFFDVRPGKVLDFPPPRIDLDPDRRERVSMPLFDAIVGNFPYIRQELIERASPGYKKQIEAVLFDDWHEHYRQLFADHSLRLSGQADIYAYLFFHAAAHLKAQGRMGIVVSNSWLDVEYGYELQKFFLSKFKIVAIVESRCEPWFEDVAVNTVFAILEQCDSAEERDAHLAKFVKLKKPLAELFPQDLANDAARRWSHVQELVDRIEGIGLGDSPSARPGAHKSFGRIDAPHVKEPPIDSYEDNHVRVRSISQADLLQAVEAAGSTVKWGLYLRAPDVYFEILQTCAKKLVPLGQVAKVRRGITTGINKFFYLTPKDADHWAIERDFLRPLVQSSKECPAIRVDRKKLRYNAFCCTKPTTQLAGTAALRYIRWGQKQLATSGKNFPQVESVQSRKQWYSLPQHEPAPILMTRIESDCLRAIHNPERFLVDCNLCEIEPKDPRHTRALLAFLNSNITFVQRELMGRANLGDGALKFEVVDFPHVLVPNPALLKRLDKAVAKVMDRIERRRVPAITQQAREPARRQLNTTILRLLGYRTSPPGDAATNLAESVVELVSERLELPRLRKRRTAARETRDIADLIQTVEEAVMASGIRRFPEAFLRGKAECEQLGVPKEPLRIGARGLAVCELTLPDGTHFAETGFERAKAICFAQRTHPDSLVITIPTQDVVLVKALKDYSTYVRDVEQRLSREFMAKSGDANLSENLTRKVLADYGLDMSD